MASPLGLAAIILVGLSAQFPNPGNFLQLDFAQGPSGGFGGVRPILLMGNKTTAGSATNDTVIYGPDTPVTCQNETDVINLFGSGSQLHRMFLKASKVNPGATYYFLAISPSSGAAATATMTIASTATSNGTHRFWCVDEFVDTSITIGDTPTVIAGNIVASINNKTRWPVTATNSVGVVTVTAKNLGPEGNWIRVQALILQPTSQITTTTTLTANGFMSGGTTADVNTTALTTIVGSRYYHIALNDSDATNIGRAVTQANSQAAALTGIRQRVFAGGMDTLSNSITIATSLNAPRSEFIWGPALDYTPCELAAYHAALYHLMEQGSPYGVAKKNFSNFPNDVQSQALWTLKPGRNGVAGAPTSAQITSALNNGLTPLTMLNAPGGGQAQLVKRITTRSLNGAVQDYRVRDAHKVSIPDFWCDDWQSILANQFGGKDLLADPVPGGKAPPATATTPGAIKAAAQGLVLNYDNAGQWSYPPGVPALPTQTEGEVINTLMIWQKETNPPTRVSGLVQLSPCDILDQTATLVQQVG